MNLFLVCLIFLLPSLLAVKLIQPEVPALTRWNLVKAGVYVMIALTGLMAYFVATPVEHVILTIVVLVEQFVVLLNIPSRKLSASLTALFGLGIVIMTFALVWYYALAIVVLPINGLQNGAFMFVTVYFPPISFGYRIVLALMQLTLYFTLNAPKSFRELS